MTKRSCGSLGCGIHGEQSINPRAGQSECRLQNGGFSLEAAHTAEPALVVGGFALDVLRHFGVREDKKALLGESLDDAIGHLLRLDGGVEEEGASGKFGAAQHVGTNTHGTKGGDFDSAVAVGNRQPLGKGQRGMLGDGIRGGSELGQQTCRGYGLQKITVAARQHGGKDGACSIDMGHQVHLPTALPIGVGSIEGARGADTGIRTEEVMAPNFWVAWLTRLTTSDSRDTSVRTASPPISVAT